MAIHDAGVGLGASGAGPAERLPAANDTMGGPAVRLEALHAGYVDGLVRSVARDEHGVHASVEGYEPEGASSLWTFTSGSWKRVRALENGQLASMSGELWRWSGNCCERLTDGVRLPVDGAPRWLEACLIGLHEGPDVVLAVARLSKTWKEVVERRTELRREKMLRIARAPVGSILLRLDGERWVGEWSGISEADPFGAKSLDAIDGVPGGDFVWAAGGNGLLLRRRRSSPQWESLSGLSVPGDDGIGSCTIHTVSACADETALIAGERTVRWTSAGPEEIHVLRSHRVCSLLRSTRTPDGANWFIGRLCDREGLSAFHATVLLRHQGGAWSLAIGAMESDELIGLVPEGKTSVVAVSRRGAVYRGDV